MRDRTWVGESGQHYAGADMVGQLWDTGLEQSLGAGRESGARRSAVRSSTGSSSGPNGKDLLTEFDSLGGEVGGA